MEIEYKPFVAHVDEEHMVRMAETESPDVQLQKNAKFLFYSPLAIPE